MNYEIISFAKTRVSHDEKRRENPYMVLHPSQDVVLAYCATSDEAFEVVREISTFCEALEKKLMDKREAAAAAATAAAEAAAATAAASIVTPPEESTNDIYTPPEEPTS